MYSQGPMSLPQPELLDQLRQIDEYDFEGLVADVWEEYGWNAEVTTGSRDRGIDVIAHKPRPFKQKVLIQAKRYNEENKVSSSEIQQYNSLRYQSNGVDTVVVVTTSSFSDAAKKMAADLNVKLVDGKSLCESISEVNSDILEDYLPVPLNKCPVCEEEIFDEGSDFETILDHCPKSKKCQRSVFKHNLLRDSEWRGYVSSQEDWNKLQRELHHQLRRGDSCPVCGEDIQSFETDQIVAHCEESFQCRRGALNYDDFRRSPWAGYIIKQSEWEKIQRKLS